MSQKEPAIWNGRWQALNSAITDLLGNLDETGEYWEQSIHSALRCLRAFGKMQFDFFQDGFQENNLVDSPSYKAEYAIRQTIDQISYDLSVLRQAFMQRHAGLSPERTRNTLLIADLLAEQALQPAIDAGILVPTCVLTYLQKSAYVRVVPYAPIAMIGIPETCTGLLDDAGNFVTDEQQKDGTVTRTHTARDFLAIAHEAGHHVFWHGKVNGVPLRSYLRSKLPSDPVWRMDWLEEIFADVYGALVAGPVLALDFQEILLDNNNLLLDDGEHPIPAIRPFIYTDTLQRLAIGTATQLSALNEQWEQALRNRGIDNKITPRGVTEPLTATRMRGLINEAITQILVALAEMQPVDASRLWSDLSTPVTPALYESFRTKMLAPMLSEAARRGPENAPGKNKPKARPAKFKANGRGTGRRNVEKIGDTIYWEEGKPLVKWFHLFTGPAANELTLLPEIWRTLLEGGGWAAGGPDNDASPKVG